jgi:hypothetical protein
MFSTARVQSAQAPSGRPVKRGVYMHVMYTNAEWAHGCPLWAYVCAVAWCQGAMNPSLRESTSILGT